MVVKDTLMIFSAVLCSRDFASEMAQFPYQTVEQLVMMVSTGGVQTQQPQLSSKLLKDDCVECLVSRMSRV